MAWEGYVQYAGNEIINVARVEAYARQASLGWFKPIYENDSLGPMLGESYVSPLHDDAPWVDPDRPESYRFCGAYPLDVGGLEDSSRASTVTESIRDGGNPGRLRHGTKAVTFNVILVGEDDQAVSYGFDWLKQALLPGPCGGGGSDCGGDDLCYLSAEPEVDLDGVEITIVSAGSVPPVDLDGGGPGDGGDDIDGGDPDDDIVDDFDGGTPFDSDSAVVVTTSVDPADCMTPLLRSLRNVLVNSGPSISAKRNLFGGGAVWTVTFTAVAGEPWEYGAEVGVIEGFLDPDVTVPWVGGVIPEGGYADLDGALFDETVCEEPVLAALQDPLCPAVVPPPLPPSVTMGCYTAPVNWRRRQITVPRQYTTLWGEMVPKFAIHARDDDVRDLRLRFYADVNGDGDISDDPCAFCGDIVVSYVPVGSSLIFDASERQVYAVDATQRRRRAEQVVFATDGSPFEWPVLTCGFGYIVTLDLPQTQPPPVFDLSLISRVA